MLDQSEVDALLAAVAAGDAETPSLGDAQSWSAQPARHDVAMYDFKRPERVSKDQMRALEAMHEGFARNFGASLSGFLRTIVETRVANCEQLTYSEFIRSLPSPTCFNLLRAPPLAGQMCLEISPLIIYPIIDRLLGGSTTETFIPQRALTNIEQRLVGRITDRALSSLTEAWENLVEAKFELAETESNPHLVQIVAPNEIVVVFGFEIKLGPHSGTMSFCIPFTAIEPIMSKLATQNWLSYTRGQQRLDNISSLKRGLSGASVGMRVFLGQTRISVRDLFSLAPGDVLPLGKPLSAEILAQVEGRNKFAGRIGQQRGNRAFLVTRRAAQDERL